MPYPPHRNSSENPFKIDFRAKKEEAAALWRNSKKRQPLPFFKLSYPLFFNVSSMGRNFLKKVSPQTPLQKLSNI